MGALEVPLWVPPAVAFAISLATSMGGVSGAFLLLPFQLSVLGITSPSASATNHLYNVIAVPAGVVRYVREGRMVWPLAWTVVACTLPGVWIGAVVRIRLLPDPGTFKVFAGIVLAWIGLRLAWQQLRTGRRAADPRRGRTAVAGGVPEVRDARIRSGRLVFRFTDVEHSAPLVGLALLSVVVGLVGGAYGIGGGAIIAPFLVAILGLPVHAVAGAALLATWCTSVFGVVVYQLLALGDPSAVAAPSWGLGVLFGLGGAAGTYCGARLQRHVPARVIGWILVGVIGTVAVRYLVGALG